MKNQRFVLFVCLLAFPVLLQAATFEVTNTNDSGAGSLRQAITDANGNAGSDTIDLSQVTGTITLASALPDITDDTTITGPSSGSLIIDADGGTTNARALTINSGSNDKTVTISDLTFQGGNVAGNGGGILVENRDTLVLIRSLVTQNQSSGHGGGLYFDDSAKGSLVNSTISGNQTSGNGGGVYFNDYAEVSLLNTTITLNSSAGVGKFGGGGGIFLGGSGFHAAGGDESIVTVKNSIITANTSDANRPDCHGNGKFASGDYNIIGINDDCTITGGTEDQLGSSAEPIDVKLIALADNGGSSKTHALDADSPAIDKGNPDGCLDQNDTALTNDQRGTSFARTGRCDVGAFEISCGDGVVSTGEACDNGAQNSDSVADACRTTCQNASCGDGVKDTGEGCDDGNQTDGDGCTAACVAEVANEPDDNNQNNDNNNDNQNNNDQANNDNAGDDNAGDDQQDQDNAGDDEETPTNEAEATPAAGGCSLVRR